MEESNQEHKDIHRDDLYAPFYHKLLEESDEFKVQASLLAEVIRRILEQKADIRLSEKPRIESKPITEFRKKIRVSGLTKFDEKTYVSAVNFYQNEKDLEKHKAAGAIIIYVPEMYVVKLFKDLQYPEMLDENDEDSLEDACGTFCNLIAGSFKSGLSQLEYKELAMSHFMSYQNTAPDGVEFQPNQKYLYEISFYIQGEKRIVADFSMGPIQKDE